MYVAGFEGGGSTARLAIATRGGEIIFRQNGAGVNAIDKPTWQKEYETLFIAAGDYLKSVQSACFGIAGWGASTQLDAQVLSWLRARLGCPICVMNDVELAHRAIFADRAGILLLSGTGSMALGRTKGGDFLRVGGFGHLLGDEGSAYWLGQQALMRLARESDGRAKKTAFGTLLSQYLQITLSLEGIMAWLDAGAHMRSHVASVAAVVDEMAEQGDEIAQDLLIRAAEELFLAWQAARDRLDKAEENHADSTRWDWAVSGSTFQSKTMYHTVRAFVGYEDIIPAQSVLDKALDIARDALR